MSFYSEYLFPRLCNFALDRPEVGLQRKQMLASAKGEILEIGLGTGLNLPHYPSAVKSLWAIEPNPGMCRQAQRRVEQSGVQVHFSPLVDGQFAFEAGRFDCVVSAFTLCSIQNVDAALKEIHRVLKPGGRFLFLEHGLSPDAAVAQWQRRLNWLESWMADGCHLDRPIGRLVANQPFHSCALDEFYLDKTPRTHGYLYRGAATK